MKKTMFITSVIMVVVMAIALTTSSLAWFNVAEGASSVSTNTVTLQAQTNSTEGLLISTDHLSWTTSAQSLTAATGSAGSLNGMYPEALYGDSVLEALAGLTFTGNYVDTSDGTNKWGAAYNATYYAGYIYVANAGDAAVTLVPTITIDNLPVDGESATLYVAVLGSTTANAATVLGDASDWYIAAVASRSANNTQSTLSQLPLSDAAFAAGDAVAPLTNASCATGSATSLAGRATGDTAVGAYQRFAVIAWFGADLTNFNSGSKTGGTISVSFAAA